jgi:hypothetical protein
MTKQKGTTWEDWLEELKKIATCCGYNVKSVNVDWNVFRLSYDDNMTPADAMLNEFSYA